MEIFLTILLGAALLAVIVGVLWVIGWAIGAEEYDCRPYIGAMFVLTVAFIALLLYAMGQLARTLLQGLAQ